MNREIQVQIVRALLERLRADAVLSQPRCTSVVSAIDLDAIVSLLGEAGHPMKTMPTDIPLLPQQEALDSQFNELQEDVPEKAILGKPLLVDTACLTAPYNPKYVVCIDFGTARSKAFAAEIPQEGESSDEMDHFELGLGKRDGDREVYSVASSVWISDDGLMFAGSEAMRRSTESHDRTRLDSIKQQLSQTSSRVDIDRSLPTDINPTQIKLTYADAICFYLAFLTDLVGRELSDLKPHSLSRYTRRRFTIPAWKDDQRQWAHSELKKLITRAQVLADTFGSRWSDGIPVSEVKDAISQAAQYDSQLSRLLDPSMDESKFGISEPMAAGAGRIRIDSSIKNLILIVDVGAGTTDIGLFLVNFAAKTAIPVEPKSGALKRAGDHIDDLLVGHIISKVEGHPDPQTIARIDSALRRSGLRRDKETLFDKGSLEVTLATGQPVKIILQEFLESEDVICFAKAIEDTLELFLRQVDKSFEAAAERPTMLLSGGGASLPFIKDLLNRKWKIGEREVKFKAGNSIPSEIAEYDQDFQKEYPQLAVAMGGAIQVIDERQPLLQYHGNASPPGQLSRYAVTGI